MSGDAGARQALKNSKPGGSHHAGGGDTVVRQVETPHVKVTVTDGGDEIKVEINYWDDQGAELHPDRGGPVRGKTPEVPVTVLLRKCPSGPC